MSFYLVKNHLFDFENVYFRDIPLVTNVVISQ